MLFTRKTFWVVNSATSFTAWIWIPASTHLLAKQTAWPLKPLKFSPRNRGQEPIRHRVLIKISIRPSPKKEGSSYYCHSSLCGKPPPAGNRCSMRTQWNTLKPSNFVLTKPPLKATTSNFTKTDARGLKQMMYFIEAKTQSLFHQENIVPNLAQVLPWYHNGAQWSPKAKLFK